MKKKKKHNPTDLFKIPRGKVVRVSASKGRDRGVSDLNPASVPWGIPGRSRLTVVSKASPAHTISM